MRLLLPGLLLLCLAAVTATALAAPEQERARDALQQLEERLEAEQEKASELAEEAEALRLEVARLREESGRAAARIQALEGDLSDGELASAVFHVAELRSAQALQHERLRLLATLAALQRLSLLPPEAALAAPGEPLDALRAALLLRGAVPALEERARRYSELHARFVHAHKTAEEERRVLAEKARELEREQKRLARLIERRREMLGGTTSAQQEARERAAATGEEARSLKQLIAQLEAEAERERQRRAEEARLAAEAAARASELREAARREAEEAREDARRGAEAQAAAEAAAQAEAEAAQRQEVVRRGDAPQEARRFPSEAAGSLTMPAQGRIAVSFGESSEEAAASQGLVIEARPGAQVVAPFDGRIAYAGEFRRYGLILIIEHDGRYHSLLAGLGRLTAAKGQWVTSGEPVGTMASDGSRHKELYLELRRAGQPINPLPWLAESGTKARG